MQTITTTELKKRIDAGEHPNLLDVREDNERADFNIGGRHVPLGKLQSMQLDDIEDWKDDEVILHCKAGARSMQAGMMLEMMGFKNVKNLVGGMNAWQQQ